MSHVEHVELTFKAAVEPKLYACIWQEFSHGDGYWNRCRTPMDCRDATRWIARELSLSTGHTGQFKFMTYAEAWNPLNSTFCPFSKHVWVPKL